MQFANRLQCLPANVFAQMDQAKQQAVQAGQSLIDLSLGSSDLPVDPDIIQVMADALGDPSTHGYLLFHGTRPLREAIATWYAGRFGLAVDPETEVLPLIGSQEGTAHLPLALLNPGDIALLQDPGYPSHAGGVYLAGGEIYGMPLLAENQFLPVFSDIPAAVIQKARMMVLSYPHNPTTAIATLAFFKRPCSFAKVMIWCWCMTFPTWIWCLRGQGRPRCCRQMAIAPVALNSSPFLSRTIWAVFEWAMPLAILS